MFVVFEGIEGCGKTTQSRLLLSWLQRKTYPVILTREPGGTHIGNKIRSLLLQTEYTDICPLTEILLYEASRAQHVEQVIRPYLDLGYIVLCDRYIDASIAYQGYGRLLDVSKIQALNSIAVGNIIPLLTFYIDIEPIIGLQRARLRNSVVDKHQSRFEQEDIDFYTRVRNGYLECVQCDPDRYIVLDGLLGIEDLSIRIQQHFSEYYDRISN